MLRNVETRQVRKTAIRPWAAVGALVVATVLVTSCNKQDHPLSRPAASRRSTPAATLPPDAVAGVRIDGAVSCDGLTGVSSGHRTARGRKRRRDRRRNRRLDGLRRRKRPRRLERGATTAWRHNRSRRLSAWSSRL